MTTHVATLICDPLAPVLDAATLAQAQTALPSAQPPRWLAAGVAADLFFTPEHGEDNRTAADRLRAALAGKPIDAVVQAQAHRRKSLLIADMDSTMIGQECIDELADKVGLKAEVAAITERAMRGELSFEPALRERLGLLRGLPVSVIAEVFGERIRPNPGAASLVRTMRANGAYTCLVSGGFTLFSERVAALIGFDEHRANRLVVTEGRLTGEAEEPILGANAKAEALVELRTRRGLTSPDTLGVGDGANDLPMLEAAGLGVAYRAKPKVRAAAHAYIEHGDLTALLYLQGYAAGEFVGP